MTEAAKQKLDSGTPSSGLQDILDRAKSMEAGGILDTGDDGYEMVTEPNPEEGIYQIVGGYVDDDGNIHNEVHVRAMTGHEEDLLGNPSVSVILRLNGIMAQCTQRIGTITDREGIIKAVHSMSSGSRTHLLMLIRVTSHWRREKDVYEMEMKCTNDTCKHVGNYKVHLLDLDRYESKDLVSRTYKFKLPYSGVDVEWRKMTGQDDHVMSLLVDASEHEQLSFSILLRLTSYNGESCELTQADLVDPNNPKKVRLSKRAADLLMKVKNLQTGDREALRDEFMDYEPGIDVDLDFECEKCHEEFYSRINVAQPNFFFPRATSRRSKRRRST